MMKIVNGEEIELASSDATVMAALQEALSGAVETLPALTARQLRLGLVANGILLDQVEAAIAGVEDAQARSVAQIEWEYASQFNRSHPLIAQIGDVLGLTSDQIDGMWSEASSL